MDIIIKDGDDWTRENGKEKLWYAENPVTKHVYLTSPMSKLQLGFVLKSTTNPKEMDRIFTRLHEQEREHNEKFIEALYNRGREKYESLRSNLRQRFQSAGVSDAEKNIIRAALKLMDEKDARSQENNVYGISGMQEAPEPLPGPSKKVLIN